MELRKDEVVVERVPKSIYGRTFYIAKYYDNNNYFHQVSEPNLNEIMKTARIIKNNFNKKRIRKTF